MKVSTPEESIFNKLCEIDAIVERLRNQAMEAGQYQLAASLRALKTFVTIAKEDALDEIVIREENPTWSPSLW